MDKKIEMLKDMIEQSNKIVFFTGAGVSTASGIPDFRSENGLYNNNSWEYSPEKMLSHSFWLTKRESFFNFYKKVFDLRKYEPNVFHKKIKELETNGKEITIVTQNVDGLHQKAGSENVIEIHGSIYKNKCKGCRKTFDSSYVFDSKDIIPKCPNCGKELKPSIILYEESLPYEQMNLAKMKIEEAEMLIIVGTSLSVYPANTLVNEYKQKNKKLVIINKDFTEKDRMANLIIREDIFNIFGQI